MSLSLTLEVGPWGGEGRVAEGRVRHVHRSKDVPELGGHPCHSNSPPQPCESFGIITTRSFACIPAAPFRAGHSRIIRQESAWPGLLALKSLFRQERAGIPSTPNSSPHTASLASQVWLKTKRESKELTLNLCLAKLSGSFCSLPCSAVLCSPYAQ